MSDFPSDRLKVFISYSWDDSQHMDWVLRLADDLSRSYGIFIILDRYDLSPGKNLAYFMEKAVLQSDKILIILTPNYKQRAESRVSGVGYEFSMISQELFENQSDNTKFIPVLRKGNSEDSRPGYLKSLIYHSMTDDDTYDSDLLKLAMFLLGKPSVQRPKLGDIQDWDKMENELDPVIEKAEKVRSRQDLLRKKQNFQNTSEFGEAICQNLKSLFNRIQEKGNLSIGKLRANMGFRNGFSEEGCTLGFQSYLTVNVQGLSLVFDYNPANLTLLISFWSFPYLPQQLGIYPEPRPLSPYHTFLVDLDDNLNVVWRDTSGKLISNELIVNKFLSEFIDRMEQT